MRFLRFTSFGRKERSDGIASKQMRLVRASMTIISQTCKYIYGHFDRSREVSSFIKPKDGYAVLSVTSTIFCSLPTKLWSFRPKRSEAEKSQRVEKNKRMRFLHVGRNDLKFDLLQATFGHFERSREV